MISTHPLFIYRREKNILFMGVDYSIRKSYNINRVNYMGI